MGVSGRTALVTGAASGIGEGVARALAAGGAAVVALDVDEAGLRRVAEGIESAVEAARERFGGVDILVNNAGVIARETPIEDLDDALIDRVLAVNLRSQLVCCRAVVGAMKERGFGRIVNIASRSWLGGAGIA